MDNKSEMATVFASLILHDEGLEVSADKISTVVAASGLKIDGIYATLFASYLAKNSLQGFIANPGGAVGAAAPAAAGGDAAAPTEAAKEDKKAAPVEESDEDMGDFGLFD